MTKSTLRLAREALRLGQAGWSPYSSRFSRHDFTQAQLFALLIVRQTLRLDYCGLVTLLAEWTDLRRAAGLLPLGCVLGDAGYDGEHNRQLCRDRLGVPRTLRPTLAGREHRLALQASRFKRRLGDALTARQPITQTQEILLRVLTHNLLLLWHATRGFQQSTTCS